MIDVRVSHGQVQITMDVVEIEGILMDLRHGRDWFELEGESEELMESLYDLGVK